MQVEFPDVVSRDVGGARDLKPLLVEENGERGDGDLLLPTLGVLF